MKPGVERAVMLNLIGAAPSPEHVLSVAPDAHPHLYGKAPRPGRKLGHITLLNPDDETVTHLESLAPAFNAGAMV
jgi:5-(carboxyamino)imidazole ribonucleotide synthase